MRKLSHAEHTEYPELYRHSYWGCFRSETPEPEIVSARNYVAAKYYLQSWCKARAPYDLMDANISRIFDHNEAYRNVHGEIICICSPYHSNDFPEWAIGLFDKIEKIYHAKADSYLAKFSSIKEIRQVVNRVKSLRFS